MKKKRLILLLSLLVLTVPALCVISGRNLTQTLEDLCAEMRTDHQLRTEAQQRFTQDYERQHQKMIDVIRNSNELSLLLYTQEQEMTFNLAYALRKVSDDYKDFSKDRRPYDNIVNSLTIEIDRYARLIESLRRLPPEKKVIQIEILPDSLLYHNDSLDLHIMNSAQSMLEKEIIEIALRDTTGIPFMLDERGESLRDTCIVLASEFLKMYADNREVVVKDSTYYQEAYLRMKETYDYAQGRNKLLKDYMFRDGQTPFLEILSQPGIYWNQIKLAIRSQYSFSDLVAADTTAIDQVPVQETGQTGQTDLTDLTGQTEAADPAPVPFDEKNPSSRGSNALLLVFCALQLIILVAFWGLTQLVIRLIGRWRKQKRLIPKSYAPLVSVLVGTILYFVVFGFIWSGDTFVQLSAKRINTFLWLLIAISGALLVRVKPTQIKHSTRLYFPTILMALLVIVFRITFVPDKLMNLFFPPFLLLAAIRQLFFCIRENGKAAPSDSILGWVAFLINCIAFGFSFSGYTFIALLILVWWYFQLALWLNIVSLMDLLSHYKEKRLNARVKAYSERISYIGGEGRKDLLFGATWHFDLVREVVIPILVLIALPLCIHLSLDIFDFDDLFDIIYRKPFVQLFDKEGFETLRISFHSIVILLGLFFILRYLNRAIHAFWQYSRYQSFLRKSHRKTVQNSDVNLSLGNSILSVFVWMVYAVIVITTLRIPTGSMSLVAGGLSAGIGLALKDTLNNFLYGIQLMGGRLRVGDWIECDGVRGKVVSINYQSVQVETIEGTEMSFLNASLFGKNFNNLTRNNAYEFTKIIVGVAYGSDVAKVREVLVEAMQQMRTQDSFGRDIVEPGRGVYVVVDNMSDSTVDIAVKQYVLVAERIAYVDKAKEVIYDALNAAGITIAFPQCDVHLIRE